MLKNMTEGNPAKLIFMFTIPLLIGNLFQQLYSMADTLIVGRTIGVGALAAVGATGSITFLIIGFAQGLTVGFSIVTAQRFGAGDERGVRQSVAVSALLSLIITIILTTLSVLYARSILEWMQTPPEIIDQAYQYINIIYWGIAASVLFNLLSNIIRALGDSRTPLLFLIIACVLNIILDLLFILGFSMGVEGAAWATVISQLVSGILCLCYMIKKLPIVRLTRAEWKADKQAWIEHMRLGLPMGFQSSIIAIGAIILQAALNSLGAMSVAAYTASQKIDMVATMPMASFGMTMATYAAQNYGARKFERIRQGVKQCCIMSVSFSVVVGLIIILAGHKLVEIFVGPGHPEVIELAQTYLVINSVMYFVLAFLFIFRFTLQGLGQSFVPTFAGVMELVMRIFAAIILADYLGFAGVCLANPLAWLGACIPLTIAYVMSVKKLVYRI
ncbi:MATE family efflux transporter [Paenibacillus aquistagni]|uniref:Probable multidrug resistance protein NorM n=1 Tax=Paenibacillus aquistagni TaxID=1852522 RepID=A0A1X7I028_9BACL|nr:MATE family efflux transporter [Paenibacillus aquistagni]SMG07647.1 putative efflux protein, MATE family [Paenibacillus aquistagni]